MTKDELKKFDGKEGRSAYIAYKGKVYDVTGSKLWKEGKHINRHFAGEDLTDQMSVAPHADDVMSRIKVVDSLEEEVLNDPGLEKLEKLRELYRKFHPHPVMIHYPMALFFFSSIMQGLFLIFGNVSFENAAFYSLVIAVITSIPATAAGIFSWWINYQKILTQTFKIKLYLSIVLIVVGIIAVILRISMPGISASSGIEMYIYNFLVFICLPIVIIIGYHGGKITWPA